MIAKNASKAIEKAVCYELQNIVKKYGPTYASEHEAYAVLKEEIEEAAEETAARGGSCRISWLQDIE